MKKLELTNKECEDISLALNFWANYIETGDIHISAQDAQNMGKGFKALNTSQMRRVVYLRELSSKVLNIEMGDIGI